MGRYRRIVGGGLLAAALLTASACGQEASPPPPQVPEPREIVMRLPEEDFRVAQTAPFPEEAARRFGIRVSYRFYTGDPREKQMLLLSSRDCDEIQRLNRDDVVQAYRNADMLEDLDDYRDVMPDFFTLLEDDIARWRIPGRRKLLKWESPGTLYGKALLPLAARVDLLARYAALPPATPDTWEAYLRNATRSYSKQADAGAPVGLAAPFGDTAALLYLSPLLVENGGRYQIAGAGTCLYDREQGRYVELAGHPDVKDSYAFLNLLYRKKLLDPQCFTDTPDDVLKKMLRGEAAAVLWFGGQLPVINEALAGNGESGRQYLSLGITAAPGDISPVWTGNQPVYSFGITRKCQEPETVAALLNWAVTPEGQAAFAEQNSRFAWAPATDTEPASLPGLAIGAEQRSLLERYGLTGNVSFANAMPRARSLTDNIVIDPLSLLGTAEKQVMELLCRHIPRLIMAETEQGFEDCYAAFLEEYAQLGYARIIAEYERLTKLYSEPA